MQPKDWGIRMNKKERRLALATALQSATASTTVVQDLKVTSPEPSVLYEVLCCHKTSSDCMATSLISLTAF